MIWLEMYWIHELFAKINKRKTIVLIKLGQMFLKSDPKKKKILESFNL